MKAIKIDSENRCLTLIDVKTLEDKQAVVGGLLAGCGYFPNNDFLMCDDEGLLKDAKYFFAVEGFSQPYAGNGIIVGTTEDGDDQDCRTTLAELHKIVKFYDLYEIHMMAKMGLI